MHYDIQDELYNFWNDKKKNINKSSKKILFKEGEIWWCTLGMNIGSEVYGKGKEFRRPVLILKKLSGESCIILPITTKDKKGNWYFQLDALNIKRVIMLHQIKSISVKRLSLRDSTINPKIFIEIKKSLAILLGLF